MVAVNPFKRLPIYAQEQIEQYVGKYSHEEPPHIFALAERAYRGMLNEGENQCVIISGESGAGKTESAKLILAYIAGVSSKSTDVESIKVCSLYFTIIKP